ncbi:hypothetical protein [Sphingomonas pituitosa]|uniref:hypothetical protein n=1 Tax=Sphingomonas pituitosa TaxID=99597 RepID=UPI000832CCDB|nr:hypothetical protein [Sphingomonas pituitosa]
MTDHDLDVAHAAPVSTPLLATLAAIALLVVAAIAAPLLLPPQPLPLLIGAGAGVGLLLWIAVLLTALRGTSMASRGGAALLLVATGAGAGLVANGQFQSRARTDASSFADVEPAADGTLRFPGDATSRGPISRQFAAVAAAEAAAQQGYGAALKRLGAGALNSPYLLTQDPHAITDCRAFSTLRATTETDGAAQAEARAKLRQAIADARLPDVAKRGIATMAGTDGADPRLTNRLAMLDATHQLCQLLAKRSWFNANGLFGFQVAADDTAYRQIQDQRQRLAAEAEQLDRGARDRMLAGRESVRDALSQSIFFAQ